MRILAIDPGPIESGFVDIISEGGEVKVLRGRKVHNEEVIEYISSGYGVEVVACEMIASYGMAVGAEVFETCVWIGRFMQHTHHLMRKFDRITRKQVCLNLCGSPKAKDANIRAALIDRLGVQGTKKNPGPTFGISGDMWSALGVGITFLDAKELSDKLCR